MSLKPPVACAQCMQAKPCKCGKPTTGIPTLGFSHQKKDAIDKLYDCARWRKFSRVLRDMNPICQHVVKGVQCRYPSELVHHLVSPRVDISRLTDPANCTAICWKCHITTEGEQRAATYCSTKWIMGAVYPHDPATAAIGTREWFVANAPK